MKQNYIRVFAMRCSSDAVFKGRIEKMQNSLKEEQQFVGGLITVVRLTEELDIVANDEGKLNRLPLNRVWLDKDGTVFDILVGNIFVCRHDDEGNFTDVLEEDIPLVLERLPAVVGITKNKILIKKEDELAEYQESKPFS